MCALWAQCVSNLIAPTATMQTTQTAPADIAVQLPEQVIVTLTELFGSDLQQWRFIVDLFCDTVDQDLANLDKAVRGGEDALIIEAAHRIVGSARMLGHQPIGDAARSIERTAQSIGPYHERKADMDIALTQLHALAGEFRQQASRCAWPDSAVAG